MNSASQPSDRRPRRILVWGATGSGKTTVARALGETLGLGVIEMDALFWETGWAETPLPAFREKVIAALGAQPHGWVSDGNYFRVRDILIPAADTIVWLKLPWRVSFWRLLRRTIARTLRREALWGTNRESLRNAFLSRESVLWWSIRRHREHRRNLARALADVPRHADVHVLASSRDVSAFIERTAHAYRDG